MVAQFTVVFDITGFFIPRRKLVNGYTEYNGDLNSVLSRPNDTADALNEAVDVHSELL